MKLTLYNTLTRKKELFKPLKKEVVSMYHCGPTVYDYAHVGNLRAFVIVDLLRRMMEYNGFTVTQVMNITDVDDKTIKRARESGVPLQQFTGQYTDLFLKDLNTLNIKRPHSLPKATEHIDEIVTLIEKLLERDIAYKGEDGSVYFDISKSPQYGKLAGISADSLSYSRELASQDEYDKNNIRDFALWKAWKPEDGDVFWETALGKGRPGWHIECSAMSMKYLGEEFDIHTGGIDLIFPHHTNEIAQSESATDTPFVKYWLHSEFVTVDGKKMAKSDGNIIRVQDIVEKGFNPLAYRYWLLQAHYRTQVNFTWEALEAAQNALHKLYEQYFAFQDGGKVSETYQKKFTEFINDDIDTPQVLALTWQLLKDDTITSEDKKATLVSFDKVLGFRFDEYKPAEIPEQVLSLAKERESARKKEDWEKADKLRKDIEKLGYTIEDTETGPKISRKL